MAEIAVLNNNYLMKRVLEIRGASAPYAEGKRRIEQVRYSWAKLTAETGVHTEQMGARAADFGVHYWRAITRSWCRSRSRSNRPSPTRRPTWTNTPGSWPGWPTRPTPTPNWSGPRPHESTIHTIDPSVLDDPARWAITWRAYKRKVVGASTSGRS